MNRREFITLVGGAAAWPLAAGAQQAKPTRRVGVLMNRAADDQSGQVQLAAFLQALQEGGWSVGQNVQIDSRWSPGDAALYRRYAAELLALAPDVILTSSTTSARALLEVTRSVPIVFASATDPVGGGLVSSLARPGGNLTGFSQREFGLSAKSLELLKEIVPGVRRVAVLRDSTTTGGVAQFGAIQTAAPALRVELVPIDVRDVGQIERDIAAFARQANGGLLATSSARLQRHRDLIITLAARHRLPAIYPFRYDVTDGGLMSYGPDTTEAYRLAAGYVGRILKGENPADLPVQTPTKYELVINLKTAKALGLTVPQTLLATSDEVIE